MSPTPDVGGHWQGHYFQYGQPHPISMELRQDGEQFVGTMRDGHPDKERSVFEMAVDEGLPPGTDETIIEQLRKMFPGSMAPVRAATSLPEMSLLRGWIEGDEVYFLKTYQGQYFHGYKVGEERVGMTLENHFVHYRGQLGADGRSIEGRWWIPADAQRGTGRAEGTFEMTWVGTQPGA
jgi:hypothetical protein